MDQSLRDAAQQGSIDALYALIQMDAKVLDRIDEISFVDTPLHKAAFAGHTLFAKEIMRLKPSFARKLNQDGFTPIHLALQNNHTQLVHRLLDVDKDLIRVQGREGVTSLHYAAQTGKLNFLDLCFRVCPDSIKDVTIRGENVLHIALKYDRVEAFLLVIKWVRRTWLIKDAFSLEKKLLYRQDEEGNTLFHVAASKVSKNLPKDSISKNCLQNFTEAFSVIFAFIFVGSKFCLAIFGYLFFLEAGVWINNYASLLLYILQVVSPLLDTDQLVDITAKNLEGHTVFDILEQRPTLTQADRLIIKDKLQKYPVRRLKAALVGFPISLFKTNVSQYVMMRRIQAVTTDEKLNALLVVGALLITVTFQAALTPPKSRQNLFLLLNALTYCLTTSILFCLIPSGFIGIVLDVLLLFLFACFCVSTLVTTTHHIIFIVLSVLFGYTFYSLFSYLMLPCLMRDRQVLKEFQIDDQFEYEEMTLE